MEKKKKQSTGMRVMVLLLLGLLAFGTLIISYCYINYRSELFSTFLEHSSDTAQAAALFVDGESTAGYLLGKDTDTGYDRTLDSLHTLRDDSEALCIFVFVPDQDGMNYVYDTTTGENAHRLGDHEQWEAEHADYIPDCLSGKEIPPLVTKRAGIKIVEVYTPIHTDSNNFIGYVSADFSLEDLNAHAHVFLLRLVALGASMILLIAVLVYVYLKKRLIRPLKEIEQASAAYLSQESGGASFENLNVNTNDELETIAKSLIAISEKSDVYIGDLHKATRMAETDALTGLSNRNALKRRIQSMLDGDGENEELHALFMLDIDGFKDVNNTYGHVTGDRLLLALAKLLRASFRSNDVVARVSADNFSVFCPNIGSLAVVQKKAENLLNIWKNTQFRSEEKLFAATLSIGIALVPYDGRTFGTLNTQADQALLAAKRDGGNRYHIITDEADLKAADL